MGRLYRRAAAHSSWKVPPKISTFISSYMSSCSSLSRNILLNSSPEIIPDVSSLEKMYLTNSYIPITTDFAVLHTHHIIPPWSYSSFFFSSSSSILLTIWSVLWVALCALASWNAFANCGWFTIIPKRSSRPPISCSTHVIDVVYTYLNGTAWVHGNHRCHHHLRRTCHGLSLHYATTNATAIRVVSAHCWFTKHSSKKLLPNILAIRRFSKLFTVSSQLLVSSNFIT